MGDAVLIAQPLGDRQALRPEPHRPASFAAITRQQPQVVERLRNPPGAPYLARDRQSLFVERAGGVRIASFAGEGAEHPQRLLDDYPGSQLARHRETLFIQGVRSEERRVGKEGRWRWW